MFAQLKCSTGKPLSFKPLLNVPTGISSLDGVLGSGFPISSLILFEEDELQLCSNTFSKCFLSEGIANSDHVFLACGDESPEQIINNLPRAVPRCEDISACSQDDLKIAWRYQNSQKNFSAPIPVKNLLVSHEFDFSKTQEDIISKDDITIWEKNDENNLSDLCKEILRTVSYRNSTISKEFPDKKKILRIVVKSLGSPLWSVDAQTILKFLFKLRTLVHNSHSIAVVSIPSKVLNSELKKKCKQLCDIVISFSSMEDNELPFSECDGLIRLLKISPINALSINVPEDNVWGYKQKKKKIIIERLHMDPVLTNTEQRKQEESSVHSLPNCQLNCC